MGTGFDDKTLAAVLAELKKLPEAKRPIKEKPLDDKDSVWLKTERCGARSSTRRSRPTRTLREPVFVRLRPDLDGQGEGSPAARTVLAADALLRSRRGKVVERCLPGSNTLNTRVSLVTSSRSRMRWLGFARTTSAPFFLTLTYTHRHADPRLLVHGVSSRSTRILPA